MIVAGDLHAVALAFLMTSCSLSFGVRLLWLALVDGRGGGVGVGPLALAKDDEVLLRHGVIVLCCAHHIPTNLNVAKKAFIYIYI